MLPHSYGITPDVDNRGVQNMRDRFCFYVDPAHGFLAVLAADLRAFNLSAADFTRYSYVSEDGERFYLEEDCDAPKFLAAFKAKLGADAVIFERQLASANPAHNFIRRMARNTKGEWKPFAR
jgi:hypothetical protein